MKKKARRYSVDFKQEAVRRMAQATTVIGLAKELGIRRKLLYQWPIVKAAWLRSCIAVQSPAYIPGPLPPAIWLCMMCCCPFAAV